MASVSYLRRFSAPVVLPLGLAIVLSACSAEGLVPPGSIDTGTRVSAITPMNDIGNGPVLEGRVGQTGYAAAAPRRLNMPADPSFDYLDTPNLAGQPVDGPASQPMSAQAYPARQPVVSGQMQVASAGTLVPPGGINMDEGLGVAPVRGLAQEEAEQIAEGNSSQPVVGGIGGDNPQLVGGGTQIPQPDWQAGVQPLRIPQQETQVAMLPRPQNPTVLQSAPPPDVMPPSEIACRQQLRKMGVSFTDRPRISNGPSCGIAWPIELKAIGKIQMRPAIPLNCQVSLAFSEWVRNELNPSAKLRYWSGVKAIIPLGGYSCRKMNNNARNPWSEHAKGNAIDVGKFVLNNGKQIDVRKKNIFAFRERGLLNAVRSDSCKYFHTVLGPGSDPQHKDHFHFDLRQRKSGYRHCD